MNSRACCDTLGDPNLQHVVKICSFNVTTLCPAQEKRAFNRVKSMPMVSKVQLLEHTLADRCIEIAGIQEGRASTSRTRKGYKHLIFEAAASSRGDYGPQVFIADSLKFETRMWKAVSTRLLFVAGAVPSGRKFSILSGHAPCEEAPPEIKDEFWELLYATADRLWLLDRSDTCLLFIDANARVGGVHAECFGSAAPLAENDNGRRFREFLLRFQLCAVNSFYDAGPTWFHSGKGSAAEGLRLDYVVVPLSLLHRCRSCSTESLCDELLAKREDHRAVIAEFSFDDSTLRTPPPARGNISYNKAALQDPWLEEHFQTEFSKRYLPKVDGTIDAQLEHLNEFSRSLALEVFGSKKGTPKKAWLSQQSWRFIRRIAPMRRLLSAFSSLRRRLWTTAVFLSWCACVALDFTPNAGEHEIQNFGWYAVARCSALVPSFYFLCRVEAVLQNSLVILRISASGLVTSDRNRFLENLAFSAHLAAKRNDFHGAFAIVRVLSGKNAASDKAIALEDGSIAPDEEQRQKRWERHFCGVFGGSVVELESLMEANAAASPESVGARELSEEDFQKYRCTPSEALASYKRIPRRKGGGTDNICSGLLVAGGLALAGAYNRIERRALSERRWPVLWRGGRIVELHKKGPTLLCDNWRGLLLADHAGKAFLERLRSFILPLYNVHMPLMQCGAVEKRGTDFAHHLLQLMLAFALLAHLSVFVLFVDLVKAFDRCIRQIVFGWPPNTSAQQRRDDLVALGLCVTAVDFILEQVSLHGSVFERWGVDPLILAMCRDLHTNTWFQYGSLSSVILTKRGARQGCKIGSLVFNASYAIGVTILQLQLANAGVLLKTVVPKGAFWAGSSAGNAGETFVSESVFVDDLCLIILASSPRLLCKAISDVLAVISTVFEKAALEINWAKGKTECFIKFRGRGAAQCYQDLRASGCMSVAVPNSPSIVLHVVDAYKHLGSICCADGSIIRDARAKASNMISSYAPIAARIFGAPDIPDALKGIFQSSLLNSRLLFNAHVVVPNAAYIATLSAPYMRVLRRRCGLMRFSKNSAAISDFEVRRLLDMPSIDCMLVQLRLRYLRRLLCFAPAPLKAALALDVCGRRLPWVRLILDDLILLRATCALPIAPPTADFCASEAWRKLIEDQPVEWDQLVSRIHFYESVADRSQKDVAAESCAVPRFACHLCQKAFPTNKQLGGHLRMVHRVRSELRFYVPDSSCPVCLTRFSNRVACILHLADSRRPKCKQLLLEGNFPRISLDECRRLDEIDRAAKRLAKRDGHSHILSSAPAVCASGRLSGVCSRSGT